MQEQDLHSLLDILISARLILRYLAEKSWAEFLLDIQLQDSVIRRLDIIAEASLRLSDEISQILRSDIVGIGKKIIHDYDKLNLVVLWDVIEHDLIPLTEELEKIVLPGLE